MADLMELYGGMGPGLGGMWAGEDHQSKILNELMSRNNTQSLINDRDARLGMAQEMHPLEMANTQSITKDRLDRLAMSQRREPYDLADLVSQTRHRNSSTDAQDFTNTVNNTIGPDLVAQGKASDIRESVSKNEESRGLRFMRDVANGADVDAAIRAHGLDGNSPQAQRIRSMTPDQRQQLYQRMVDSDAKAMEKRKEEAARAAREERLHQMDNETKLKIAAGHDKARVDAAKERLSMVNNKMNLEQQYTAYQREAAGLYQEMMSASTPEGKMELNKLWMFASNNMERIGQMILAQRNQPKANTIDPRQFNLKTNPTPPTPLPPGMNPPMGEPPQPPQGNPNTPPGLNPQVQPNDPLGIR